MHSARLDHVLLREHLPNLCPNLGTYDFAYQLDVNSLIRRNVLRIASLRHFTHLGPQLADHLVGWLYASLIMMQQLRAVA